MESRIEKRVALRAPVARVWRTLTDYRELGQWFRVKLDGPFVTRSGLTGPHHLTWLCAPEMGSLGREDGARTTILIYLASLCSRSPKRLCNGNANTRRIRIGKDPNRNAASVTESGFDK